MLIANQLKKQVKLSIPCSIMHDAAHPVLKIPIVSGISDPTHLLHNFEIQKANLFSSSTTTSKCDIDLFITVELDVNGDVSISVSDENGTRLGHIHNPKGSEIPDGQDVQDLLL